MSELYLLNGRITTQDAAIPHATAVAMRAGRFTAVGSDAEIRALAGPGARVIDLAGRRVLPGLADSHVHFYDWATGLRQLKLENTASLADVLAILAPAAEAAAPRRWIIGQGWNATDWPEGRLPDRHDLDRLAPENPVFLMHASLHLAVANTSALRFAGITTGTPNPPQGIIDRDEHGEPTGILRDLAMNLITGTMPPMDEDEAAAAFKEGFAIFHSLGLTGVTDQRLMGAPEGAAAFRLWQRLHHAGEIRLRVWMNLSGDRLDELIGLGLRTGFGDEVFRTGHVKFFTDGAQGPRTAWMLEPYEGTDNTGLPLTPMTDVAAAVRRAHAAGLAVGIHAIGDRANRELIDIFEKMEAEEIAGPTAAPLAPHRIEHLQIVRPEDLRRLARLNVVASVQPESIPDDMSMMEPTIGARACYAYPFRTIWDLGIPVVLSSDCPVCNPNPFWGIHAAVTRQRRDGTPAGGWYPDERLTVAQAVWGFSMGAAVVCGRQVDLGSITPGKLADLVVLDRDIFTIDPMEIYQTRPALTVFDGQIVYQSDN